MKHDLHCRCRHSYSPELEHLKDGLTLHGPLNIRSISGIAVIVSYIITCRSWIGIFVVCLLLVLFLSLTIKNSKRSSLTINLLPVEQFFFTGMSIVNRANENQKENPVLIFDFSVRAV